MSYGEEWCSCRVGEVQAMQEQVTIKVCEDLEKQNEASPIELERQNAASRAELVRQNAELSAYFEKK